MKDPGGGAAPSGGFQDLGWYNGYQYYQGSFAPQAGMIHPNSPQQGAGQKVSSEVNRQSDAAQGNKPGTIDAYVAQQNTSQPGWGNTSTGSGLSGMSGMTGAPQTPNLEETYKNLFETEEMRAMQKKIAD